MSAVNIIFDGPPGPVSGRFVEVETDEGEGIKVGEWIEREDGLWSLRITEIAKLMDSMELAWGLIANAYGGDWDNAPSGWREAAIKWRDNHWYPSLERNKGNLSDVTEERLSHY